MFEFSSYNEMSQLLNLLGRAAIPFKLRPLLNGLQVIAYYHDGSEIGKVECYLDGVKHYKIGLLKTDSDKRKYKPAIDIFNHWYNLYMEKGISK